MKILLPLILLFLLPLSVLAAPQPVLLGFADSLAADGDHYRAITEYKRFIFAQPDSELVPRARLSIAKSLLAGKRWREADEAFEALFLLHPRTPQSTNGKRLYADGAYDRGAFGLARERYRSLLKDHNKTRTVDYANFRIGWTFLEQNRVQQARKSFALLPDEERTRLDSDLDSYEKLPRKSPGLAGTLSALLPGAGQAYTGRYRQAVVSLLLNGAFILGALEAFDNDNNAVGAAFAFFELGWYGGNIYNATSNAHKFNRRVRQKFKQQMRDRLNLQVGMLQSAPLIRLSYRF